MNVSSCDARSCCEAPRGALVTRIAEEPKSRWRPLPLNTVQCLGLDGNEGLVSHV